MKQRNKWKESNIRLKQAEIKTVIRVLNDRKFRKCLLLGAGDGYQAEFLTHFCEKVVATDLNEKRLFSEKGSKRVEKLVADAEKLEEGLRNKSFDLIFSSNLLEHVSAIDLALDNFKDCATNDALYVHILPNRLWLIANWSLFYPVRIMRLLSRMRGKFTTNKSDNNRSKWGNNFKKDKNNTKMTIIQKIFPVPHGVSENLFQEFSVFGQKKWVEIFRNHGYELIGVYPGPISSGYATNLNSVKLPLSKLGLTTQFIYLMKLRKSE